MSEFERWAPALAIALMRDLALPAFQACGFVGNFAVETGEFRLFQEESPLVRGSRGGLGLGQWTGSRRDEFEAFCRQHGLEPHSVAGGYPFVIVELEGQEARALRKVRATTTLEGATKAVEVYYERPGIAHSERRLAYARQALALLGGTAGPAAAPEPSTPSAAVVRMQQHLVALGFDVGPDGCDGDFGPNTERALKAFQAATWVTGECDERTWQALRDALQARQANPQKSPQGSQEPAWLTVARGYLGLKEIKGPQHAPEILKWWKLIGTSFGDDETPWCAAFVGGCLEEAGIMSSKSGLARSYERWGVPLDRPAAGAVAIYWRGSRNSGSGHVHFVAGQDSGGRIIGLGGNQGDAVTLAPGDPDRLIGYVWPKGVPLPAGQALPRVEATTKSRAEA